jgi:murein L,D-transpeptidase YcbB/YkuD
MSLERGRSEPEGERSTSARRLDGASVEQQIVSLHSAIGNVAFSRVVSQSLASRLSRKTAGERRGHKRASAPAAETSGSGMLRQGARGPRVESLQMDLSAYGGHPIAIDGIFGPQTDGAVRSFQAEEGLEADGIVGPLTSAALSRRKGDLLPGILNWGDLTIR